MIPASDGNCSLFTNPFTACTPSSPNPSQIESECFGYPLISTNSVSSSFSEGDSCSNRLNHLLVAENTISHPPFLPSPRCHPQPLLFSTLQWRELLGVNFSLFLSYLFAVIFFVSPRLFWRSAGRYQWCLGGFINWDGTLKGRWLLVSLEPVASI